MGRNHIVPLPLQAFALLDELRRMTGNGEYLFPSLHLETPNVREHSESSFTPDAATVSSLSKCTYAPLADIADITLASTALGGPILGDNTAGRIAELNIFHVVFVEFARLDHASAARRLSLTSKAVTIKRRS